MILKEVVTAPATTTLTTLADVKLMLGISGTTDDTYLNKVISGASKFISTFCNRDFARTRIIEKVKPERDQSVLVLSNFPAVTIHSVSYDGEALEATDYITDRKDFGIIDAKEFTLFVNTGKYYKYEVNYTYGYLLPNDVGNNLPLDIQLACNQLVKAIFLTRSAHPNTKMVEVPEVYRTAFAGGDLPNTVFNQFLSPEIKMLLHAYRKYRI